MHGAVETDLGPAVRMLALATGTIGGFLTAVTVQILLWHTNVEIGAGWRDLFVDANAQMRSALAWWLIAGTALVSGFIAAAIARFLMLNWWPLRWPRWIAGIALVAGLAAVGDIAAEPTEVEAPAYVIANLAGMTVGLITACLGAFFAARR
jgi:hypothetical protein